ncbi:alpha/beta hydrolase [Micromonospora sp. WMMD734]|uniref:alpha/beta hydrolase n=1 Tax=Micromonospora sp. WMMD734 TaxID=3404129 RepID=UPI003B93629B
MVDTEDVSFTAGAQRLTATKVYPSGRAPLHTLHLHGLGPTASRHAIRYLLDPLAEQGHAAVTFDFSGNGDSTGTYLDGSLRRRLDEALAAARLLDPGEAPVLIGSSMGAHLAACAVPALRPRGLIFFAPAAYAADATDVPFHGYLANAPDAENPVRPGDFADSPAYQGIGQFTGDLLIVAGGRDEVVPPTVVEGYLVHARRARSTSVIWLDDCAHFIHRWLPDRHELRDDVLMAMSRVLTAVPAKS